MYSLGFDSSAGNFVTLCLFAGFSPDMFSLLPSADIDVYFKGHLFLFGIPWQLGIF